MYGSVVFRILIKLCTHYHYIIPECSQDPKNKLYPLAVTPPLPLHPQPPQPQIYFLSLIDRILTKLTVLLTVVLLYLKAKCYRQKETVSLILPEFNRRM